ncbi:hypothetical protein [uncultured Methylophaga sp.]|uniref:hypothetical protein n=1 Tax=uncultured Methylophaga sp. TaxID=285271 RepID=UPI0026365BE2|nr:hypothetical protein [uncultured Methylophaga sp.]
MQQDTEPLSPPPETPREKLWALHRTLTARLLSELQKTNEPVSAATMAVARMFLMDNGIYTSGGKDGLIRGLQPLQEVELEDFEEFSLGPAKEDETDD